MRVSLLAVVLLTVVLGGCSDDDSEPVADPSSSPSVSASAGDDLPGCESVWVEGATLPADYDGCTDAAGALVPAEPWVCRDDVTGIVSFGDELWAVTGQEIHARAPGLMQDDPVFMAAYGVCVPSESPTTAP